MQTGNEVLEPLNEMDILRIAKEIKTRRAKNSANAVKKQNEAKKHNKGTEGSGAL